MLSDSGSVELKLYTTRVASVKELGGEGGKCTTFPRGFECNF